MNVTGILLDIKHLTPDQIHILYTLMTKYYDGIDLVRFRQDLFAKDKIILLLNKQDEPIGFSTQQFISLQYRSKEIQVVFSGDTIIDKAYWGTTALPVTWGQMMLDIQSQFPTKDLYWFLISKGYRTYRFLPVFFKDYYPRRDLPTPVYEKNMIALLCQTLFPGRYDSERQIIRGAEEPQRLKPEYAEIASERLKHQDIQYFVQSNPNYGNGDELACIAKFDTWNLSPFLLKRILAK